MIAFAACAAFTLVCVAILLVTSFAVAARGRPLRPGEREIDREAMRDHLVWGLVYSNPDDPRGWVPKIRGVGWTVNVRDRGVATLLALVTVATIGGVLLSIVALFPLIKH